MTTILRLLKSQQNVYSHSSGCMRIITIQTQGPEFSDRVSFKAPLPFSNALKEELLKNGVPEEVLKKAYNVGLTRDGRIEVTTPKREYNFYL